VGMWATAAFCSCPHIHDPLAHAGSRGMPDPFYRKKVAQSAFGADAYPDLVSKAAALMHSLVLNHAFVDGNKRTAVLATLIFLDLNGYVIRWDQHEALDFVLRLVAHQVELHDVIAFLRSRMHPKDFVDSRRPEEQ